MAIQRAQKALGKINQTDDSALLHNNFKFFISITSLDPLKHLDITFTGYQLNMWMRLRTQYSANFNTFKEEKNHFAI